MRSQDPALIIPILAATTLIATIAALAMTSLLHRASSMYMSTLSHVVWLTLSPQEGLTLKELRGRLNVAHVLYSDALLSGALRRLNERGLVLGVMTDDGRVYFAAINDDTKTHRGEGHLSSARQEPRE